MSSGLKRAANRTAGLTGLRKYHVQKTTRAVHLRLPRTVIDHRLSGGLGRGLLAHPLPTPRECLLLTFLLVGDLCGPHAHDDRDKRTQN